MWVFTRDGFFSVVQDHHDPSTVWIRARSRADMVRLVNRFTFAVKRPKIVVTPERDYRYRIKSSKQAWSVVMEREAAAIDYGNFKGSIPHDDKVRHRMLMDIWARLVQYQNESNPENTRRKNR